MRSVIARDNQGNEREVPICRRCGRLEYGTSVLMLYGPQRGDDVGICTTCLCGDADERHARIDEYQRRAEQYLSLFTGPREGRS